MNPYDWQSHKPQVKVPRPALAKVAKTLGRGGSAVVLGGRGMGKSVFLQQVCTSLEREMRVVVVPAPPPELTVRACLDKLADALGVPAGAIDSRKILDSYFARGDAPKRLVLLFDEFDRYAEKADHRATNPPGRGFFNDLEATRRDLRPLGVLATGSIGVYVVRDILGSSFLARALHVTLSSFERLEVSRLARPFAERGKTLPEEVLDALQLATGGIPALVTFGLEQLWELSRRPVERDIADIFAEFREEHGEYLRDLLRSVSDPQLSEAPRRVWELIRSRPGPLSRAVLEEAVDGGNGNPPLVPLRGNPPFVPLRGNLDLDLVDALRLLQATGLVRFASSFYADPVTAHPVAGLLNLPTSSPPGERLREELVRDLGRLLAKLHGSSADFFRPTDGKRLVPEAVFAAYLALGFEFLGWQTEREAQNAAGRTDLKLRRNGSPKLVVIEVKIWGRNDYREAQQQIESYWTAEVAAGAVVQLTDAEIPDWPESYRRECLESCVTSVETQSLVDSPIRARLACVSETADGLTAHVDHLLLRLPRRS
ncbi:MAG: hypothetical protein GY856_35020 [bacterium]|nr:hypothetical protein [bacterium]